MAKLASFPKKSSGNSAKPNVPALASGQKKPWELVPTGDYTARLISFEEKETKAGDGMYINAKFEIDVTEKRKLLVFQKFHIANKNRRTVEIDAKRLTFLAKATGLGEMTDTDQLHDIVGVDFLASVDVQVSKNDYPDQNVIKRFGRI